MPAWLKLTFLLVALALWIIPISASIPFIYENRYFLVLIISYILLVTIFVLFVLFGDREVYKKQSNKERIGVYLGLILGPILIGFCLSLLAPITSDLLASEFAIHEYKAVGIEQYANSIRSLSTLFVVDVKNNEASFVIKNEMLNQLNLHAGDKLVVRGRSCIVGFVIDNINGIELARVQ